MMLATKSQTVTSNVTTVPDNDVDAEEVQTPLLYPINVFYDELLGIDYQHTIDCPTSAPAKKTMFNINKVPADHYLYNTPYAEDFLTGCTKREAEQMVQQYFVNYGLPKISNIKGVRCINKWLSEFYPNENITVFNVTDDQLYKFFDGYRTKRFKEELAYGSMKYIQHILKFVKSPVKLTPFKFLCKKYNMTPEECFKTVFRTIKYKRQRNALNAEDEHFIRLLLEQICTQFLHLPIPKVYDCSNSVDNAEQLERFVQRLEHPMLYMNTDHEDEQEERRVSVETTIRLHRKVLSEEYLTKYLLPHIDLALTVVCVLATNMRISEVGQLTWRQIQSIINKNPINIRVKKRIQTIKVVGNIPLLRKFLPILKQIELLRNFYATESVFGYNRNKLFLINRIQSNKVLLHTASTINARFRDAYDALLRTYHIVKREQCTILGVQAIRKINTTILVQHNNYNAAKMFNRHSNARITNYYNTRNFYSSKMNTIFPS